MLECRPLPQRQSARPQPQAETHQHDEQQQRHHVQQHLETPCGRFDGGPAVGEQRADLLQRRRARDRHQCLQGLVDDRQQVTQQTGMGEQRLGGIGIRPGRGRARRKLLDPLLQRHDGIRRAIEREMEGGRRQRAGRGHQLRILGAEYAAGAREADIRQRVLQQRIAALEALGQLLLLRHRRGEAVDGLRIEAFRKRTGAETLDCVLHRLHRLGERIVVAQQTGTRLQDIAVERGLREGEVVERLERNRIRRGIAVDRAQEQPREQRKQQQRPDRSRPQPHGTAVPAAAAPAAIGRPR